MLGKKVDGFTLLSLRHHTVHSSTNENSRSGIRAFVKLLRHLRQAYRQLSSGDGSAYIYCLEWTLHAGSY